MKTFKIFFFLSITVIIFITESVYAQSRAAREAVVQRLIDSKTFTFQAESATPMSGGNIRLTSSNYQVIFYKDSLNSFLPYFGTAFRAPYGVTESPLIFSSSDFTSVSNTSKKGGKTIRIKINSPDDPDVITLSVSASGYGTLQVSSVNRQPISFYGTITSNDKKSN